MRPRRLCLSAATAAVLSATPVMAGDPIGDPEVGLAFARLHCAECHYVERDWADLYVHDAPDFIDIAAEPSFSAMALKVFFRTPHRRMPNLILTETQQEDVIAYILSLRPERQQ
ncbi:MAG: cytochrome C [Pseudomonadota bacterium]